MVSLIYRNNWPLTETFGVKRRHFEQRRAVLTLTQGAFQRENIQKLPCGSAPSSGEISLARELSLALTQIRSRKPFLSSTSVP